MRTAVICGAVVVLLGVTAPPTRVNSSGVEALARKELRTKKKALKHQARISKRLHKRSEAGFELLQAGPLVSPLFGM